MTNSKSKAKKIISNEKESINETADKLADKINDKINETINDDSSKEEKINDIKSIITNYLASIKSNTYSIINNSILLIKSNIAKSIDFTNYYLNSFITKSKENPLITYNSIYLITLSTLSGFAFYYHKYYLATQNCTNCHDNIKPIHILASIGLGASVMGIGNYLYIKKKDEN